MKKLFITAVLGAAMAMFAGCAAAQPASPGITPTAAAQSLAQVTTADLDNAIAISTANGNAEQVKCWTALKGHIGTAAAPAPAVTGVFSAFAAASGVTSQLIGGAPKDVHEACSPVVTTAQDTLLKLGLIAGGVKLLPLAPLALPLQ